MSKKYTKPIILLILLILAVYIGKFSSIGQFFNREYLETQMNALGIWAPIAFMGLYTLATVLFIPGTPLTLAGGFLFGIIKGTIFVVIGATIGASIAFLVARYLGKEFIDKLLKDKFKGLHKYDKKLEENGLVWMLFLRLVPLFPFNGLNFALGLTKIRFRDYFLGTLIGIIPGSSIYVYAGSLISKVGETDNLLKYAFSDPKLYMFLTLFVILLIIPYVYKKKFAKKNEGE